MAKAGTAYVDFEGNFSGLHKQVNSQLKPLGGRFSKIGKVAALGIGAGMVGLVKVGKDAVEAFQESEKVGAQTTAVLKSTGKAAGLSAKQIGTLATAISKKSGLDDEAVQSGENLLLTFTNVRNEAGKGNQIFSRATGIMADMSTALGQDMKSSAIQLGKALNDPIKGVTALQRVGVSFTAQQKEQIKTLVEHGHTLDAQKIILRELNKEFGGSAAAFGKTSAGQVAKLKTEFGNLQEKIGGALAPAITTVTVKLRKFIEQMQSGSGAGGRFVAAVKGAFDKAKQALQPLTTALGNIWGDRSLNIGEKLSAALAVAGPFVADAAAKLFASAAPRAARAFLNAFQSAGVFGRLFILGALLSKLGVFSSLGKLAASKMVDAFGKNLKFAGVLGGLIALMGVFGRFSGATKSAAQASRELADAMDDERNAIRALRDQNVDLAQARANVKASALAVEQAEKDLDTARKQSGKNSLAARQAENNLTQARLQHKREVTALGDAEQDASSKRRKAVQSVDDMRQKQLEAAKASGGFAGAVDYLQSKIAKLPASKKVRIDVEVAQAIANVNAASDAIGAMLDRANRAIDRASQARAHAGSTDGMARSPLLFNLEDRLRLAQSALDQMQAMFDRNDERANLATLRRHAHLGTELSKISKDNRDSVRQARTDLRDFEQEMSRTAKLGKINLRIEGVQKVIDLRNALKAVRGELGDKLTAAMDKFHDRWEKTVGADLDKAATAALDAFDTETARQIGEGPAAQALRDLQATEDQINAERTDQQEQQAIDDANAAVAAAKTQDEKVAAQKQLDDAKFAQAETARQRQITTAQQAAEDERVRIEKDRAAARTALEDQQQAERQARYDADSAAFQTLLKTQLDAEYAQLQQRKENYSQFAKDVNKIFKQFGLGFLLATDADTEAAIENAPKKKPGGGKGKPRAVASAVHVDNHLKLYIDGKEIDVRVDQAVNSRDRGTAAAVAGGVG